MGGNGSTRWRGHEAKPLIEETQALDLMDPAIKSALEAAAPTENLGVGTRLILCLSDPSATEIAVERVQIGVAARWLLVCPGCDRRARKLYFVSAPNRLVCRRCGDLEYESVQRHDSRIDDARRDPYGWWEGRDRLGGRRSQIVSWRIWTEAVQAGVRWVAPEEALRWAADGAPDCIRKALEKVPLPRRLPNRRDRRRASPVG